MERAGSAGFAVRSAGRRVRVVEQRRFGDSELLVGAVVHADVARADVHRRMQRRRRLYVPGRDRVHAGERVLLGHRVRRGRGARVLPGEWVLGEAGPRAVRHSPVHGFRMRLAWTAAAWLVLAGCNQAPNCAPNEGGGQVTVQVVDQATGDNACGASVTVICGSNHQSTDGCSAQFDTRYTGTCDVYVTAPGFAPSHTSVAVSTTSCSTSSQELDATDTVKLVAACDSTVVHDDGLGDKWVDCTPSSTFDAVEGNEACRASGVAYPFKCEYASCHAGDAGVGSMFCSGPGGHCWCYSGPCAGYVLSPKVAMSCDIRGAPSWG